MVISPLPKMHWLHCQLAEIFVLLLWWLFHEITPKVVTVWLYFCKFSSHRHAWKTG